MTKFIERRSVHIDQSKSSECMEKASKRQLKCLICGSQRINYVLTCRNWRILSCQQCANAWTDPFPEVQEYATEDFHAQFEYRVVADLPPQWKKSVLRQADLVSKYVRPSGRILEIGCGEGIFLKELRKRGYYAEGIEPSQSASQRARDAGLKVTTGSFPDTRIKGSFDALVMNHVLEHSLNPILFLENASGITSSGTIFLMQSNWKGLVSKIQRESWHAWAPDHHYWHFTPAGLKQILRILQWRVLKIRYSSLYHGNSLISRVGAIIPGQGDQFHMVAKIC